MKEIILIFGFFLISVLGHAQDKYDYNWKFGYWNKVGVDTPLYTGGNTLSFLDKQVSISGDEDQHSWIIRTSATISNRQGELQFFSNGCWIENMAGEIMENGDSITTSFLELVNNCDTEKGNGRIDQGGVILPSSQDSNQYFFINQVSEVITLPGGSFYFTAIRLQYAKVDMSLNQGLGKVLEKGVVIIDDSLEFEYVIPCKHQNGKDWWILQKIDSTNLFYTILFQNDSFKITGIQESGIIEPYNTGTSGNAGFSPDCQYFAIYNRGAHVQLFSFNNATGMLSDYQMLLVTDTTTLGGLAFSPNSQYLYVANFDTLWQYDLDATDIQTSQTVVGIWDGYYQGSLPTKFHQMQPGPDCRLYMSCAAAVPFLHVIHHPDRKGLDCGFEQRAISLPYYNGNTLPNTPYYRAGTPYAICDSTIQFITTSTEEPEASALQLKLWPNPASDLVWLSVEGYRPSWPEWVTVTDMTGRQVYSSIWRDDVPLEVNSWHPGIYIVQVLGREGVRWVERLVVPAR